MLFGGYFGFFELFQVFSEHFLLLSQFVLLVVEFQKQRLRVSPEGSDLFHFHVEVQVTAHQFRVLGLVFLIWIQ